MAAENVSWAATSAPEISEPSLHFSHRREYHATLRFSPENSLDEFSRLVC